MWEPNARQKHVTWADEQGGELERVLTFSDATEPFEGHVSWMLVLCAIAIAMIIIGLMVFYKKKARR